MPVHQKRMLLVESSEALRKSQEEVARFLEQKQKCPGADLAKASVAKGFFLENTRLSMHFSVE